MEWWMDRACMRKSIYTGEQAPYKWTSEGKYSQIYLVNKFNRLLYYIFVSSSGIPSVLLVSWPFYQLHRSGSFPTAIQQNLTITGRKIAALVHLNCNCTETFLACCFLPFTVASAWTSFCSWTDAICPNYSRTQNCQLTNYTKKLVRRVQPITDDLETLLVRPVPKINTIKVSSSLL